MLNDYTMSTLAAQRRDEMTRTAENDRLFRSLRPSQDRATNNRARTLLGALRRSLPALGRLVTRGSVVTPVKA